MIESIPIFSGHNRASLGYQVRRLGCTTNVVDLLLRVPARCSHLVRDVIAATFSDAALSLPHLLLGFALLDCTDDAVSYGIAKWMLFG